MIVADTNLIAYLLIPGDKSALAESVLKKDANWAAPLIWRSEFRNVLTLYMRHEDLSLPQAKQTMGKAEHLLQRNEFMVPSDDVLELTSKKPLSAYDAEFVVLAQRLNVKLITLDKPILKAFPRIAFHPDSFK